MYVRVVTISSKAGMEEKLRQIGRNVLVPLNKDAGCVDVYFMKPSLEANNPYFGVVSIWRDKESLESMKNSKNYREMLKNMGPLIESVTDHLYVVD
ncbi:putative quinol monooxygenase [Brevibacillus porteri]|uniref:putative quinol monooxygenase n=1 Tax=Brevibacillus porteri TaxID=2126350 RepID=UPI00362E2734